MKKNLFPDALVAFIAGGDEQVELYSLKGGCQYNLTPYPTAMTMELMLVYLNNMILACGGPGSKTCYQYNIPSNSWTNVTTAKYLHNYRDGKVYNNKLYIVDDANSEVYDPITNVWSAWPSPLMYVGDGPCIVPWKDSFIVFGGYGGRRQVQRYNHITKTWDILITNTAPTEMVYPGCVLLPSEQDILVVGSQEPPFKFASSIYNIQSNTFKRLPDTRVDRGGTYLARFGSRVFAFGGDTTNTISEFLYNQNNTWVTSPFTMKRPTVAHMSALPLPAKMFQNIAGGCVGF